MTKVFVTGAAGFIGSHFVDRLLAEPLTIIGFDNFSTGRREFLAGALRQPHFRLEEGDLLDADRLTQAMAGCDLVVHLAANADVRFGLDHPEKDLQQNTVGTFRVLEAMRRNGVNTLAFASTGSVYGEATIIPTPEEAPFPVQTSLYAASKLAGEALIQAYCEGFGFEGYIFRFVSILGERYTHGHVLDFYQQLTEHSGRLRVLGDGTQRKSYLYVQDCIDAMLAVIRQKTAQRAKHRVAVYNLGTTEYCQVTDSIGWICDYLHLRPELEFSGGSRGWVGDNPFIFLSTDKIQASGWRPKLSIREAMIRTLTWLEKNPWVFTKRH